MTDTPEEPEPSTDVDLQETPVDGSLILAEFPSELLVILAETLGNPLALLVSKAHLSKAFREAARDALGLLKHACLHEWKRTVDDAVVAAVVSYCTQLTSLSLRDCRTITDAAVVALASGCKQLSSLRLTNITAATVVAVVSNCTQLSTLDLCLNDRITDVAVVAVASNCTQLSSLDLSDCRRITDAGVVAVALACKQLTSLNIRGCPNITDAAKANIPNTIQINPGEGPRAPPWPRIHE